MDQQKNTIPQYPLLPAIFILVAVFFLLFLTFQAASRALPAPTAFPTLQPLTLTQAPSPTSSPTLTSTPTRTPRPTWTLEPTSTSTQTFTPAPTGTATPLPTLTPATPYKYNNFYKLSTWAPDQANLMVEQLQSYPDALFPEPKDHQNPTYLANFTYATIAQREALLRFPSSAYAPAWRWSLAYNLARIDDIQAGAQYATLITEGLNSRHANLTSLPAWFSQQEPHLKLSLTPLTPMPGYLSSQVVFIQGNGGTFLWLLETPNGFQAHMLDSRFDFSHPIDSHFFTGDLTQDGSTDITIFYSPSPDNLVFTTPRVFNLSRIPPVELAFQPTLLLNIGVDYKNDWSIQGNQLRFTGSLFPSCPLQIQRTYHWNGSLLEAANPQFQIHPDPSLLSECQMDIDHSALFWGPDVTAQLMEPLATPWPPKTDTHGHPYPIDAHDEWIYQMGIEYALAGKQDQAVQKLTTVIKEPIIPESRWIIPANQFLQAYQKPDGLYRACIQAAPCDPHRALQQVVYTIPLSDYGSIPMILERFGVAQRSSGFFDFENDGETERWILVRHRPQDKLEFWILFRRPDRIQAVFVDTVDTSNPAPRYHDPAEKPPIIQIKTKQGFIVHRIPGTQEAYLTYVTVAFTPTTFTIDTLDNAQNALFSGTNPAQVRDTLVQLQDASKFNCLNYRICDRFTYILGLANELSGHPQDAIDAYLLLWRSQPSSPFTIMARLKLQAIPLSSPTPTRTPTGTQSVTPNPSPATTGTPTMTSTITPSGTVSVTVTVMATGTATITPTITETPTP